MCVQRDFQDRINKLNEQILKKKNRKVGYGITGYFSFYSSVYTLAREKKPRISSAY